MSLPAVTVHEIYYVSFYSWRAMSKGFKRTALIISLRARTVVAPRHTKALSVENSRHKKVMLVISPSDREIDQKNR